MGNLKSNVRHKSAYKSNHPVLHTDDEEVSYRHRKSEQTFNRSKIREKYFTKLLGSEVMNDLNHSLSELDQDRLNSKYQ